MSIESLEDFQRYIRENPGKYIAVDGDLLWKIIHAIAHAALVAEIFDQDPEDYEHYFPELAAAMKDLTNDIKWIGLKFPKEEE